MRKRFLYIKRNVYPETLIIGAFMFLHLADSPLRYYLVAVVLLLFALYKVSKNFLHTLWLAFLAVLPFARGRYYEFVVVPQTISGWTWDLAFNATLLFSDALLLGVLYVLITRYKKYKDKKPATLSDKGMFLSLMLFMIVSAFSVSFSRFPTTSSYFYLQLTKLVVVFFVSKIIFIDKQIVKKTFQILTVFVLANALLVVVQYINRGPLGFAAEGLGSLYGQFSSESPDLYRPGGFVTDPNIAASFFAIFLPMVLIKAVLTKKGKSLLPWSAVGLIILAIVFTASRASWAVAIFAAVFAMFYIKRWYKAKMPGMLQKYWRVVLLVFLVFAGPLILDRLSTLGGIFQPEGGGTYRLDHLRTGWHFLKTYPFGVGLGSFPFSMALDFPANEFGLNPTLAHNLFAQIGGETGFLGVIVFIAFLWITIRKALKITKHKVDPLTLGVTLSLLSFILLALVFPWFLHPSIGWLFWILLGYNGMQKSEERKLAK